MEISPEPTPDGHSHHITEEVKCLLDSLLCTLSNREEPSPSLPTTRALVKASDSYLPWRELLERFELGNVVLCGINNANIPPLFMSNPAL